MACTCVPWRVEVDRTSYRSCSYPGVRGHSTLRAWVIRKPWQDRKHPWRAYFGGVDVHELMPSATRSEARAKADDRLRSWCERWTGGGLSGCGCGRKR